MDRIFEILNTLVDWLPGRPDTPESPLLQFHAGLGLGMFMARLYDEHFADVGGVNVSIC